MDYNSRPSCNCLISEERSVHCKFKVNRFPLIVVVMHNINISMNNWLSNEKEEEHSCKWEHKSDPVLCNTSI